MTTIDPERVRSLVRRLLKERFEVSSPTSLELHASHRTITAGPECSEEDGLFPRRPCLIEPHRPCYNSGYCKTLGY